MARIEGPTGNVAGVNAAGQLQITDSTRTRLGVFAATSPLIAVAAAAQTGTTAHAYLFNPPASARTLAIRRVETHSMGVALAAAITRLTMNRFTATGAFTGAEVAPIKIDTTSGNNVGRFSTVSTGLTLTAGAVAYTFFTMAVITAAGTVTPVLLEYEPREEGMIVLRAGEGVLFQQPDAGVATDPRRLAINVAWEEF